MYFSLLCNKYSIVGLMQHCSVTFQSFNRQPLGTFKSIPEVIVSVNQLSVHLINIQWNVVFCTK